MNTPISMATAAYGQTQKLINQTSKGMEGLTPAPTDGAGSGFADLVAESLSSVVEAGKVSDQKSLELVGGKANIVDAVTAIAETEVAIESMVAIRDRVISAYEEIMRMPI